MSGLIPPDVLERIRQSTDIVELISGYVQLQRKGGNYFGLCPFHAEKTPSFSLHPGKGIFHCFGCGTGGNAITFLQLHDKLSFAEAARELARRNGIAIPEDRPERVEKFDALYRANEIAQQFYSLSLWKGADPEHEAARQYLTQRRISQDLAKTFGLGYAPDRWDGLKKAIGRLGHQEPTLRDFMDAGLIVRKEESSYDRFRARLMFPIYNLTSKVIGFGGRALKADAEGAKYVNSPETQIYHKGSLLYGLHLAREQIRRRGECLIVEGYLDLMRLHEAGFSNAVASSGTALTEEQARLLRRFCQKAILIFDGDAAGSHASVRGADVLLAADFDVRVVGLPAQHDPDTFILQEGAAAFGDLIDAAVDVVSYRIELYRREGRLADVPQRSAAARELLETIRIIPDPIRRELTAQEAAKQMGLATETLLKELARTKPAARTTERSDSNKPTEAWASALPKERALLETLIRWRELRAPVFQALNSQDFQHPLLRRIAARLEAGWVSGRDLEGEALIEEETPFEEVAFISQATATTEAEAAPSVDRKAMRRYLDFHQAHDCLRDLLVQKLALALDELKQKFSATPDFAQTRIFVDQVKKIKKDMKLIKSREFWKLPKDPSLEFKKGGAGLMDDS